MHNLFILSMAILHKCVAGLLLCSFVLMLSYRVDGVQEDITLTREEELEIDNELQRLNKPAVKTVKTAYGDLYGCVDFYKQPAFDNPLLKNHTFHPGMRPSGHRSVSERSSEDTKSMFEHIKFVTVDCPSGTVPIRRVTKEELVRTKLNKKRYALTHGVLNDEEPKVFYAITRTKFVQNKWYRGGSAYISVYNVTIEDPRQYSLARMRLQSGTDSIEVGTQTNPTIYNDLVTRIFVRTKTSYMDKFNQQPSIPDAFIQVLQGSPIDMRVEPVSERGVKYFSVKVTVKVDEKTGFWWFYLGVGAKQLTMGFWAPSFSGGMDGLATGVDWGGEVSGPQGVPSAPMGSGECPEEDTLYDGFCGMMKVFDDPGRNEIDVGDTETYRDTYFYKVIDQGFANPTSRRLMLFGGPGQNGKSCSGFDK